MGHYVFWVTTIIFSEWNKKPSVLLGLEKVYVKWIETDIILAKIEMNLTF